MLLDVQKLLQDGLSIDTPNQYGVTLVSHTVEVGFYEPSALMNFFQISLECLFKLITPDFMNFLDMELINSFSENLIPFISR